MSETVSRKQRPIDLFFAIPPTAPFCDGRQERFDLVSFELTVNNRFVP